MRWRNLIAVSDALRYRPITRFKSLNEQTIITIDGMAVAQTIILIMHTGKCKTCKHNDHDRYAENQAGARVIFDIYNNVTSLRSQVR